jgi:hypothetical protein
MKKRALLTVLLAAIVAVPAAAGVYYEATTRVDGQQGGMGDMKVKAWASGDKAKIEFEQSGNPMAGAGTYLITKDGGRTLYLVNPKEKTYSEWDMEAMLSGAMAMVKGVMSMTFSNPKVEKLLEEPGGTVVGLPTTHYRYRTSYSTEVKILGMRQATNTVQEEDIWATSELVEKALGIWLRKEPPKTGDEQLDALMRAEMGKVEGFPLKRVTVTTNTDQKGKKQVSTMTMEVTTLQVTPVSDSTFVIPASYTETQLIPAAGEGGEDNPLSKIFGGKKK